MAAALPLPPERLERGTEILALLGKYAMAPAPDPALLLREDGARFVDRQVRPARSARLQFKRGGKVSGRRHYIRSHVASLGSVRISRPVTLEGDAKGAGLAVLSSAPFPVGADLTLSLATTSSIEELSVRVTAAEPQVVNGSMRHRLQLAILPATPEAPAAISDAGCD